MFLLLGSLVIASASDADFDGVDDLNDKCPNTPFSDLSDANGCTTISLYTPTQYDIIMGYNYASSNPNTLEDTKTSSTTLQADFYHGNFSGQIQASYYKSTGSSYNTQGANDTQLALYYSLKPLTTLTIQAGAGIILPTYETGYNNEASDYLGSLSLKYSPTNNIDFFGGYTHTMINDDNIPNLVDYQDTDAFYAGIGYMSANNASLHLSYTNAQSIYVGVENIETLSCGMMIPLDSHWFILGDYRYGLSSSASDNEIALRIGYAF